MSTENAWNKLKEWRKKAENFGPGNLLVTQGLGRANSSVESQKSVYSLLYIKMSEIFATELGNHVGLNHKDDSFHKILEKAEALKLDLNFDKLHCIKNIRNKIAHQPDFIVGTVDFHTDWDTLEHELNKIQ